MNRLKCSLSHAQSSELLRGIKLYMFPCIKIIIYYPTGSDNTFLSGRSLVHISGRRFLGCRNPSPSTRFKEDMISVKNVTMNISEHLLGQFIQDTTSGDCS